MSQKKSYEEVNNYIESKNFILVSDTYISNKTKITIKDSLEYFYVTTLLNMSYSKKFDRFGKSNPYTIQNIKLWCKINNKSFELVDGQEYKGSNKKLKWKCLKEECGEIFAICWGNIQQGDSCPFCVGRRVCLSNCLATKRPDLAAEWHPTLNGELTPYNVTCSSNKKVWWQCSKNPKHVWETEVSSRNKENGCPYCSGKKGWKLPSEDYNLLICNPELCKEWNYNKNEKLPTEYTPGSKQKVWWICKDCNHEWEASINNRNNKKCGCPKCNQSKGENKINDVFIDNNINYIFHHVFLDCKYKYALEFDFYLPDYNICIEYQGKQHYEPVDFAGRGEEWAKEQFKENQLKDQIKRDYCKNNNIKLLEISYKKFDNIEEIIKSELELFK